MDKLLFSTYPAIILHDAVIEKIIVTAEYVTFCFGEKGFSVTNCQQKIQPMYFWTGASIKIHRRKSDFYPTEEVILLKERKGLFLKIKVWERMTLDEFAVCVNEKGWRPEIIYESYGCDIMELRGEIHLPRDYFRGGLFNLFILLDKEIEYYDECGNKLLL